MRLLNALPPKKKQKPTPQSHFRCSLFKKEMNPSDSRKEEGGEGSAEF